MKKDTLKTAGIVATAVMTLGSCGQKRVPDDTMQTTIYKTDSAANALPEYKNTANAIGLYEAQIQMYRDANKNMVKYYAKEYIKRAIKDMRLRNFLLSSMDEQILMEVSCLDADEYAYDTDLDSCYVTRMRFVRRNHRWYDALMMYLLDKYNEKQLLGTDFFSTIKDKGLKETFEYNAEQIARLTSVTKVASKREEVIYNDLWRQYSNGKQRKR